MTISRRDFIAGTAATVAAVAAPPVFAAAAPRDIQSARIAAVRFSTETEQGTGHRAVRRYLTVSRWHYDPTTYPGNPLIRHEATGLTFRIEQDSDFELYVRRIFMRSDPVDLAHDRYLVIGHAARRTAAERWPSNQKSIYYVEHRNEPPQDFRHWRAHDPNIVYLSPAPPMQIDLA